jgi:glycosyltransferase involved in cell wall biosynthesis
MILVLSAPPMIAALVSGIKVLYRCPIVYLIQDLYPDIAVELGLFSRHGVPAWILEKLSRITMRSADSVITLGRCMRDRVRAKGIAAEKIVVLENWADGKQIRNVLAKDNRFLKDQGGLEGKFIVCYSGNMGKVHDFQSILCVIEELKDDPEFAFVFIGEGPQKDEITEFAERHKLSNLQFFPYFSREDLSHTLSAADVALISLSEEASGLVVPSKLYSIMAAGVPAVFIGPRESEAARTIVESGCGYVVANHDPAGLKRCLRSLRAEKLTARSMGARGRATFEQRFERQIVTSKYYELFASLSRNGSKRPPSNHLQEGDAKRMSGS